MTKAELNKAVKKFAKQIKERSIDPDSIEAKKEFNRLHNADGSFKSFNEESLRTMIALNRTFHFIPPHMFAIYVDY